MRSYLQVQLRNSNGTGMLQIPVETIVASLAAQHTLLNQEIATFHHALRTHNLVEIHRALERMNQFVVAHCKFEDEQFYPPLLEKLKGDAELLRTVSLFHGNFARIGDGVFAFFRRWKVPPTTEQLVAFEADWKTAHRLLAGRIRDEEKLLLPLFRRIHAETPGELEAVEPALQRTGTRQRG